MSDQAREALANRHELDDAADLCAIGACDTCDAKRLDDAILWAAKSRYARPVARWKFDVFEVAQRLGGWAR